MISERLYEIALVTVIAVIILAFGVSEMMDFTRESRRMSLKTDLQRLRTAIALHRSRTNTYPASIEDIASEGLGDNMMLLMHNVDAKGRISDPFGRRYRYNPATGEVRSRTPGYEDY